MADNWQTKLEASASKLAEQVQKALSLDVYTYGADITKPDDPAGKKRSLAETHMTPDGDVKQVIPLQSDGETLGVNQAVYDVHLKAVEQAIQTRKEMLNFVKELLVEMKELLS